MSASRTVKQEVKSAANWSNVVIPFSLGRLARLKLRLPFSAPASEAARETLRRGCCCAGLEDSPPCGLAKLCSSASKSTACPRQFQTLLRTEMLKCECAPCIYKFTSAAAPAPTLPPSNYNVPQSSAQAEKGNVPGVAVRGGAMPGCQQHTASPARACAVALQPAGQ